MSLSDKDVIPRTGKNKKEWERRADWKCRQSQWPAAGGTGAPFKKPWRLEHLEIMKYQKILTWKIRLGMQIGQ